MRKFSIKSLFQKRIEKKDIFWKVILLVLILKKMKIKEIPLENKMEIFHSRTIFLTILLLFFSCSIGTNPVLPSELLEGRIVEISPLKSSIIIDDYFENRKKTIFIPSTDSLKALKKDSVIKVWVDRDGDVLTAQRIVGTRSCDRTGIKRRFRRLFGCNCGKNCKCKTCDVKKGKGKGRGRR